MHDSNTYFLISSYLLISMENKSSLSPQAVKMLKPDRIEHSVSESI